MMMLAFRRNRHYYVFKWLLLWIVVLLFVCTKTNAAVAFVVTSHTRSVVCCSSSPHRQRLYHSSFLPSSVVVMNMKRPILDQIATTLFKLETARVNATSVRDNDGRMGEPMEWSESQSLANQFSEAMAKNPWGYQFKQWIADIVAGNDYDQQAVETKIDSFIANVDTDDDDQQQQDDVAVAMFSFTTCPFCRRAKDALDEKGIPYRTMELDELEGNEGNEIRAVLGKRTKRTSMPSIFVKGQYIGGCNDGQPGLLPLIESGQLDEMLK